MGRFNMGSTIIVLFGPNAVEWSPALLPARSCAWARPWAGGRSKDRALSFQRAVEKRTFALCSKFYTDLHGSADAADSTLPPENG
jgi:hypothetical protein